MDELGRRYLELASAMRLAMSGDVVDLGRVRTDACALLALACSPWLIAQARALAAAASLLDGGSSELAADVADLDLPSGDTGSTAALDDLLAGSGSIARRLERHRRAVAIPPDAIVDQATSILGLLRERAAADLEPARDAVGSVELRVVSDAAAERVRVLTEGRTTAIVVNAARTWTPDDLVATLAAAAYPGRHLARLARPSMPAWEPSPETTVLRGLEVVGREVLLGDFELAAEIERLGRRIGQRWRGDHLLAVRRAVEEIAVWLSVRPDRVEPALLNVARDLFGVRPSALDPVEWLARAEAPRLVREWLTVIGQTQGLQRLVSEPLVPSELRHEIDRAG